MDIPKNRQANNQTRWRNADKGIDKQAWRITNK